MCKNIQGQDLVWKENIWQMQADCHKHYAKLLRQNSNDLFVIKTKSAIAALMHNTNFDDTETHHRYCPKNIYIVGENARKEF